MPKTRCTLALTVLVLVGGCSRGSAEPTATGATASPVAPTATTASSWAAPSYGPAVPGVTALAYRARIDYATTGQFQIRVHNTGPEPFTVSGVTLDSPGFQRLAATPKQSEFQPGALIDLRSTYGTAICGDGISPEPAYALLDVLRPDGRSEQLRVPLPSDNNTIPGIHAERCRAQAIAAAVTVTLVDLAVEQQNGAATVSGSLRLHRAGSTASIAVVDMLGSVVLQVRPDAGTDLPVELAASDTDLAVPIRIRQATCDPHYLAEVKTPFQFPLWLSFDGGDKQYSEIPVTTQQKDFLQGYLGDVCQ
ncbi:MAG: hypothetical protein ACR2KN_02680 [Geodermatophilaceae bacterium]